MIFDLFGSNKNSNLVGKLGEDLREAFKSFQKLEGEYGKKLNFVKKIKEDLAKDRGSLDSKAGARAIMGETNRILKVVWFEEKVDRAQVSYSLKALDVLKELLDKWRENSALSKLTYAEYCDLNALEECLRNLVAVLRTQKSWLEKHASDHSSFVANLGG